MDINYDKIKQIYGEEMLYNIKDNFEIVSNNIRYLIFLEFNDIEDIFERYVPLFINSNFKQKMDSLIAKLGPNYVDLIENDLGLLEELL